MPSSFGLWFSAYAETLIDDVVMLNAAFAIADQNPLGSAAGFGTSFPIDRKATTDELDFSDLKYVHSSSVINGENGCKRVRIVRTHFNAITRVISDCLSSFS